MDFEHAKKEGLIHIVGREIDEAYIKQILELSLVSTTSARITFSPLHAAGSTNVLPVLRARGFNVEMVKEQEKPDGSFPTATSDLINPEYAEVMALATARGQEQNADLVIVSDPDADRMSVAIKKRLDSSELSLLSGNEVGALLTHFILSRFKEEKKLSPKKLVIKTYVTTSLISDIAKGFNVKIVDDLLVGFKYIGQVIEALEDKNDFVFAAEESLGYLAGTFVRDKDAAIAGLLFAQMVSWLKDKHKSVPQYLDELYSEYGYYKNILYVSQMKGKQGFLKKKTIMQGLRENPPKELAGARVLKVIDRLPKEKRTLENYKVGATGDQITFVLGEDERTRVTVRPSGTEQILKYYIQYYQQAGENLAQTKKSADQKVTIIQKEIIAYQDGGKLHA